MDRKNFDMLNIPDCLEKIKYLKPDWIINCAAFTNVDLAESQKETAMQVNFYATIALAQELKKLGGRFLQISTDYVFDGLQRKPYSTLAKRSPLSLYGFSKAKAEESLENIFNGTDQGIILRTSWLISPYGKNFLLTIMKLLLKNKDINVVDDQIGCPTSAFSLAEVCWKIIELKDNKNLFDNKKNIILHWHDDGEANWYELALSIRNLGKEIGLIKSNSKIIPVKTSNYTSLAKRPLYSVLECESTKNILNCKGLNWRSATKNILEKIYFEVNNKYSFKQKSNL